MGKNKQNKVASNNNTNTEAPNSPDPRAQDPPSSNDQNSFNALLALEDEGEVEIVPPLRQDSPPESSHDEQESSSSDVSTVAAGYYDKLVASTKMKIADALLSEQCDILEFHYQCLTLAAENPLSADATYNAIEKAVTALGQFKAAQHRDALPPPSTPHPITVNVPSSSINAEGTEGNLQAIAKDFTDKYSKSLATPPSQTDLIQNAKAIVYFRKFLRQFPNCSEKMHKFRVNKFWETLPEGDPTGAPLTIYNKIEDFGERILMIQLQSFLNLHKDTPIYKSLLMNTNNGPLDGKQLIAGIEKHYGVTSSLKAMMYFAVYAFQNLLGMTPLTKAADSIDAASIVTYSQEAEEILQIFRIQFMPGSSIADTLLTIFKIQYFQNTLHHSQSLLGEKAVDNVFNVISTVYDSCYARDPANAAAATKKVIELTGNFSPLYLENRLLNQTKGTLSGSCTPPPNPCWSHTEALNLKAPSKSPSESSKSKTNKSSSSTTAESTSSSSSKPIDEQNEFMKKSTVHMIKNLLEHEPNVTKEKGIERFQQGYRGQFKARNKPSNDKPKFQVGEKKFNYPNSKNYEYSFKKRADGLADATVLFTTVWDELSSTAPTSAPPAEKVVLVMTVCSNPFSSTQTIERDENGDLLREPLDTSEPDHVENDVKKFILKVSLQADTPSLTGLTAPEDLGKFLSRYNNVASEAGPAKFFLDSCASIPIGNFRQMSFCIPIPRGCSQLKTGGDVILTATHFGFIFVRLTSTAGTIIEMSIPCIAIAGHSSNIISQGYLRDYLPHTGVQDNLDDPKSSTLLLNNNPINLSRGDDGCTSLDLEVFRPTLPLDEGQVERMKKQFRTAKPMIFGDSTGKLQEIRQLLATRTSRPKTSPKKGKSGKRASTTRKHPSIHFSPPEVDFIVTSLNEGIPEPEIARLVSEKFHLNAPINRSTRSGKHLAHNVQSITSKIRNSNLKVLAKQLKEGSTQSTPDYGYPRSALRLPTPKAPDFREPPLSL
jgi:hypothetical protein